MWRVERDGANGNTLTDDSVRVAMCSGACDSLGSSSPSLSSDECKHSGLVCRLLPVRIERDDWLHCFPSWSVKKLIKRSLFVRKDLSWGVKKPSMLNSQWHGLTPRGEICLNVLLCGVFVRMSFTVHESSQNSLPITSKCVRLCDRYRGNCMDSSSTVLIISLVMAKILHLFSDLFLSFRNSLEWETVRIKGDTFPVIFKWAWWELAKL